MASTSWRGQPAEEDENGVGGGGDKTLQDGRQFLYC